MVQLFLSPRHSFLIIAALLAIHWDELAESNFSVVAFDKFVTVPMVWIAGCNLAESAFLGIGPERAATGECLRDRYLTEFDKAADSLNLPKLRNMRKPISFFAATVLSHLQVPHMISLLL